MTSLCDPCVPEFTDDEEVLSSMHAKQQHGMFLVQVWTENTYALGPRGLERKKNSAFGAFSVDFSVII